MPSMALASSFNGYTPNSQPFFSCVLAQHLHPPALVASLVLFVMRHNREEQRVRAFLWV
jgi:hypothetical protein